MAFLNQNIRTVLFARGALLCVAAIWGSSLVVVKNTANSLPPLFLLAMRFTLACAVLCAASFRKLKVVNRDYLKSGAVIGLCLFSAYGIQTIGVLSAMPGKSAFLSSVYCVIVPFLFWAVEKRQPDRYNILAAVLCILGIGLASVTEDFSISKGDSLALLSGFFFAAHIVSVAKFGKGKDPFIITILQFGYSAAFSWLLSLALEHEAIQWSQGALWGGLYLSIVCTGAALLLQNIGQKYTDPSSASIILSLESVFGILFSTIFYHEALNLRLVTGFALIFTAVLISETKLSFIRHIRGKRHAENET
ncbi:DMT family transporter [Caproicibacter fermentans]|uniref:DMT family transporter n=1 Tax=Caproicibacter fermentans TaxID=2576756 RepID=A0A7G8TAL8_9FIRM|nr:DMT family transporter [Caproicibacter fermentans]